MQAKQRTPQAAWGDIPGELPDASLPEDVNLKAVAQSAVIKLNGLKQEDLASNAIWRDLLSLTGYYRTFFSASTVFTTLTKLSLQKKRSLFRIKESRKPRIAKSAQGSTWVDIDILFTAQHGNLAQNCMGTVSVITSGDGNWRIWMLRTWLECFDGYGHPDVLDPVAKHDTDLEQGTHNTSNGISDHENTQYGAIVVGGGQAGLAVGGRLKALGVTYVVLDNHEQVGDVWAKRYESLKCRVANFLRHELRVLPIGTRHTSKEYGNLPFGHTYPNHDAYAMPTKRIGAGHRIWAERYGINMSTSTTVKYASWDDATSTWVVEASNPNGAVSLRARNLVLTIGPGHGTPAYPSWAAEDKVVSSGFKGTILHSFAGYHSAHEWAGQSGIVIGTANTAHDVAEDMANAGMETTMVQRSPTFVFPAEWLWAAEDRHYRADYDPAVADRETFTYPNKVLREIVNQAVHAGIGAHPERFDALEKAGFKLDRFGDIYEHLYVRFGGHYVDIGCSARIAKGEIKMKTQGIKELTENGLLFEDGEEVRADLIVLCTGFDHDFRNDAARILESNVADNIDDFYGMDEQGEIRGHAKPAGHPNLYYHGGDVRMCRFFSRFIALQIQADVLGYPMQPYLE